MIAVARVTEDDVTPSPRYPRLESTRENAPSFFGSAAPECPAIHPDRSAALAAALLQRIGGERYDLWFDRKTRFHFPSDRILVVETANDFAANWIRGKFSADLRAVATDVLGFPVELCIRVGQNVMSIPDPAPAYAESRTVWASPSPGNNSSMPAAIQLKYTLEEFVVGPSNQMAYHAACQVAQNPGKQFNPLFIHGHCGLGKTHLLQGICQRFAKLFPGKKWLYLTGEQFTNDFLEAIKTHKTEAFRRRLRSTDLLVIDDVHFLSNKKATQEEFLHTFNQVDAGGKQVVLASDCAPKQIHSLSEQLSSRFISGMVLRVDSPDLPTRLDILRRRVARQGWNVSDAVLMHVAQTATSSVRELEGLLLQVIASMSLINSGKTSVTDGVLTQLRERTAMRGPVPVERVVDAVAEHFSLAAPAILGSGREKAVSLARSIAMYLVRQHTSMSYPEIGRALGHKNHSTVIAACQRVQSLISSGELLAWNHHEPASGNQATIVLRHQSTSDALHDLEAAIRRPA